MGSHIVRLGVGGVGRAVVGPQLRPHWVSCQQWLGTLPLSLPLRWSAET